MDMGDSLLSIGYSEFRSVKSTLGTVRYILVGMRVPPVRDQKGNIKTLVPEKGSYKNPVFLFTMSVVIFEHDVIGRQEPWEY